MAKEKKSHLGAIITLIIIGAIIVGGVVGYSMVYDASNPTTTQDENFSIEKTMTKKVFAGFDNLATNNGNYQLSLTQEELNQTLLLLVNQSGTNLQENLRGVELTIDAEKQTYTFSVYVTFSFFKTKINLTTNLQETDEAYVFTIQSLSIGKINGLESIALNILKGVVSEDSINSIFKNNGLSLTMSYNNKNLTYNKADLIQDASILLSSYSDNTLYSALLEEFLSLDLLSFDFYTDKSLSVGLDLSLFSNNVNYVTTDKNLTDLDLKTYVDNLETLLDNKIIDNSGSHDQYVYDYLTKGYTNISDEAKAYIDTLDLSSIGITINQLYTGYQHDSDNQDIVENTILNNQENLLTEGVITLDEEIVNEYLLSQSQFVTTGYVLTGLVEDNDYDVVYFAIDNCYINFLQDSNGDERMYLTLGLSVNGYETVLCLDSVKTESTAFGMTMTIDNIAFGNHSMNENLQNEIFSLVGDALSTSDWLTFDATSKTFTIDFQPYLSEYISTIEILGYTLSLETTINGSSLSDDGYLTLTGSITN